MSLYDILHNRGCINVLKELYDVEHVLKTSHTLRLSQLLLKLPSTLRIKDAIILLHYEKLIEKDKTEDGKDIILSLSSKGKQLFEQFDKLRKVYEEEPQAPKGARIEYALTELEKKIIIICFKMQQETGTIVSLRSLTQEVYPNKNPSNRIGAISQYVGRLAELKLMEKIRSEQKSYAKVTEIGERVIKEQFMENTI